MPKSKLLKLVDDIVNSGNANGVTNDKASDRPLNEDSIEISISDNGDNQEVFNDVKKKPSLTPTTFKDSAVNQKIRKGSTKNNDLNHKNKVKFEIM